MILKVTPLKMDGEVARASEGFCPYPLHWKDRPGNLIDETPQPLTVNPDGTVSCRTTLEGGKIVEVIMQLEWVP